MRLFFIFGCLLFSTQILASDPCAKALSRKIYVPSISTATEYLKEAHFDKDKFPQKNMSRIDETKQFVLDGEFKEQLLIKKKLLDHNRQRIIKTLDEPGIKEAGQEVLDLLVRILPEQQPTHFSREGAFLVNRTTGQRWNVETLNEDPLTIAGQLVQEDLVLVKERADGEHYLVGGFLAFPSQWSLESMLGQTMTQIHSHATVTEEGVRNLNKMINGLLHVLKPDHIVLRNNWLLWTDPTLPAPDYRRVNYRGAEVTSENIGTTLFLRSERQTLRRLPKSGYILFTLHVYVFPMKDVVQVEGVPERVLGGLKLLKDEMGDDVPDFYSTLVEYIRGFKKE